MCQTTSPLRLTMRSSKTGRKTSSVASPVWHVLLKPNVANILLFNFYEQKSVHHGPITIATDCNPHQTVTRFGCVGFSIYACGVSVLQMRQFWLFTYPPRSKWALSEKIIFFAKIGIFCKSTDPSVVQAYTQPYWFGGKIKLIICQIRHKLSVTIHETSTSWKKR